MLDSFLIKFFYFNLFDRILLYVYWYMYRKNSRIFLKGVLNNLLFDKVYCIINLYLYDGDFCIFFVYFNR